MIGKSCNVTAACRMLGVSRASAYSRRKAWPHFDREWDEAIKLGTMQLEYALVLNACNFLEGGEPDYDAPVTEMTTEHAIQLLSLYKKSTWPERRKRSWRYRPRDLEEVRGSILRKLEAIQRHGEWEDEQKRQAGDKGAY